MPTRATSALTRSGTSRSPTGCGCATCQGCSTGSSTGCARASSRCCSRSTPRPSRTRTACAATMPSSLATTPAAWPRWRWDRPSCCSFAPRGRRAFGPRGRLAVGSAADLRGNRHEAPGGCKLPLRRSDLSASNGQLASACLRARRTPSLRRRCASPHMTARRPSLALGLPCAQVHQDTTDFTFTIALNPLEQYDGGGTVFPTLRAHDAHEDDPCEPPRRALAHPAAHPPAGPAHPAHRARPPAAHGKHRAHA